MKAWTSDSTFVFYVDSIFSALFLITVKKGVWRIERRKKKDMEKLLLFLSFKSVPFLLGTLSLHICDCSPDRNPDHVLALTHHSKIEQMLFCRVLCFWCWSQLPCLWNHLGKEFLHETDSDSNVGANSVSGDNNLMVFQKVCGWQILIWSLLYSKINVLTFCPFCLVFHCLWQ